MSLSNAASSLTTVTLSAPGNPGTHHPAVQLPLQELLPTRWGVPDEVCGIRGDPSYGELGAPLRRNDGGHIQATIQRYNGHTSSFRLERYRRRSGPSKTVA